MYGLVKVTIIIKKRNRKRYKLQASNSGKHRGLHRDLAHSSRPAFWFVMVVWWANPTWQRQHFREILWGWSLSLWQPTLEQKHHYDRNCLHGRHWAAVCIHATLLPPCEFSQIFVSVVYIQPKAKGKTTEATTHAVTHKCQPLWPDATFLGLSLL